MKKIYISVYIQAVLYFFCFNMLGNMNFFPRLLFSSLHTEVAAGLKSNLLHFQERYYSRRPEQAGAGIMDLRVVVGRLCCQAYD